MQHLMIENLSKKTKSKSETFTEIKIVKSMKTLMIKTKSFTKDTSWWIDSTADDHVCFDKNIFENYTSLKNIYINTANNEQISILEQDSVLLDIVVNDIKSQIRLNNVYHYSLLKYNLLSIEVIEVKNYIIRIKDDKFDFIDEDDEISLSEIRISKDDYVVDASKSYKKSFKFSRVYHNSKIFWRQ